MKIKNLAVILSIGLFTNVSAAGNSHPTLTEVGADIKTSIFGTNETTSFNIVKEVTINSPLYVVEVDGDYVLVNRDGSFLASGNFVNVKDQKDIKSEWVSSVVKPLHDKMTPDKYISYRPKGDVKDVLWVYSDPSCGYCRQLHAEIPSLNKKGIEVRVVPFIRALHNGISAFELGQITAAYSAPDNASKVELLNSLMAGRKIEGTESLQGTSAIRDGFKNAMAAGATGTPVLVNSHGVVRVGMLDSKLISERFMSIK